MVFFFPLIPNGDDGKPNLLFSYFISILISVNDVDLDAIVRESMLKILMLTSPPAPSNIRDKCKKH